MVAVGDPDLVTMLWGVVAVLVGEAIRLWSASHLVKASKLTISGPFRWVRNPLYVGSFVIACGYCIMTGGWLVWAIVMALFGATHFCAVRCEERALLSAFGSEFADYCARVPRWIPRPPARNIGVAARGSWERVRLNRELRSVSGTVLMVLIFAAKLWFNSVRK